MNFDDILTAAADFSSEGIGRGLLDAAIFLYELLYPANSEGFEGVEPEA